MTWVIRIKTKIVNVLVLAHRIDLFCTSMWISCIVYFIHNPSVVVLIQRRTTFIRVYHILQRTIVVASSRTDLFKRIIQKRNTSGQEQIDILGPSGDGGAI